MNRIKQLIIIGIIFLFVTGCALISSVKEINNEDVEPQKYGYGDKSLIFVPIVHFGQEKFYTNLQDSIINWKSNGYTVFYEEINTVGLDSAELRSYSLKWRKITGGTGKTRADYAELSETFEGGITQPEYNKLGIDSADINADVSLGQLVDKYENLYGEVKLNDCDRSTPFDASYLCGEKLTNDLFPVIRDYRNEQLAQNIIESDLKKIVIIYGKDHLDGVQDILNQKQPLTK